MHIIGVTGTIGVGKTTITRLFAEQGVSTWSADEAVERLYGKEGEGTKRLAEVLDNEFFSPDGVNKEALRKKIGEDKRLLEQVECIVHPLVRKDRINFLDREREKGSEFVVLEIPLLFETGGEREVNTIIAVTAPLEVQKRRVLRKRKLTLEEYKTLLERQMPDVEKQEHADYVVESVTIDEARSSIFEILKDIRKEFKG